MPLRKTGEDSLWTFLNNIGAVAHDLHTSLPTN